MKLTASPSVKWSVYAGIYVFVCGAAMVIPLGVVATTLVKILGLPTAFTVVLVPGSAAVIGTIVWWTVTERRNAYSYANGVIFGLVTSVVTVLFWGLVVAIVWGLQAVRISAIVIGFVLVVASPVGSIAGLPLMHVRRRLTDRS